MKRLFSLLLMVSLISTSLLAQSLSYTTQFPLPTVTTDGDGYAHFTYPNARGTGDEGMPDLPWSGTSLLLPQGVEALEVVVDEVIYYAEDAQFIPAPSPAWFPMSKPAPEGYKPVPNAAIYSQKSTFPANSVKDLTTGFLQGHGIASLLICPIEFMPNEGSVRFIREIRYSLVCGVTAQSKAAELLLRKPTSAAQRLESLVNSSELLNGYNYPEKKSTDDVDMLIISRTNLFAAFDDYIDYKSKTGFVIELLDVGQVTADYPGQDDQEKIRNCVIDYYENHNLEYLILAGDSDPDNSSDYIIPHRGMTVNAGSQDEDDMPSDLYYSGLDGNWNADGDSDWGELGEQDVFAEVSIARLCVDSQSEITAFTNKLERYQDQPVVGQIKNALMIGEKMDDEPTWGGDCKDEIIAGCSTGVSTVGIPADYSVSTLYDRDSYWSMNQVFNKVNTTGIHFLNHLGHSNTDYNMKMYVSDVTTSNFNNDGVSQSYFIGYSQGCYNGSFDNRTTWSGYYNNQDCFAEAITTLANGEVASVANSRYGWYSPGGTGACSQYLDRQFYDAMFGEDIFKVGDVNANSKEENAPYINNVYYRWAIYETNLFGDPSMDIWTDTPHDIVCSPTLTISLGGTAYSIETGEPFARVALIQNDLLIGRGVANETGFAEVEIFEPIASTDAIQLSIVAHNANRFYSSIAVVSGEPYVVYESVIVNDAAANSNGLLDYGETVGLDVTLSNGGDQVSSSCVATLSCTNPYITIVDGEASYGEIAAGYTVTVDEAFTITTANNLPDGEVISFELSVAGASVWESSFTVIGHAPQLAFGAVSINDAAGNGNGRLDAGEEIILNIELQNSGTGDASNLDISYTTASIFIQALTSSTQLVAVEAGAVEMAQLSFEVDAATAQGELVQFDLLAETGAYSAETEWDAFVGLAVEDWEDGDFTRFLWAGNATPWVMNESAAFEGDYCAKSGQISHDESSELTIDLEILQDGEISFYRKVSSQVDMDMLYFYIDNSKKGEWSGDLDWERVSYPVTAGAHTFKWIYEKDNALNSGWDCGYIDYIVMPPNNYPVSVADLATNDEMELFPIPFSETLNLLLPDSFTSGEVTLYNMQGQVVLKATISDDKRIELATESLSAGLYLVRVDAGQEVFLKRAVKQ